MVNFWNSLPPKVKDTIDRLWRTWLQTFLGVAGYTGIQQHFNQIHWMSAAEAATLTVIFTLGFALVSAPLPVGDPNTVGTVSVTDLNNRAANKKATKKPAA